MLEEVTAKLLLDRLTAAERELAELKQRIRALEAQPAIRYAGVWASGRTYARGAAVTDHGGLPTARG
jgi:hypothetical protein